MFLLTNINIIIPRIQIALLILVLLMLKIGIVLGEIPFVLADGIHQIGLKKDLISVFEDKQSQWRIQEISSLSFRDSFQTAPNDHLMNTDKRATYWLRFVLTNKSTSSKWLLEMFDHNINNIHFYCQNGNNSFIEKKSGNEFPFEQRHLLHKNFEFDIDLLPGETKTYYIQIKSRNSNIITPEIRTYKRFIAYALNEYYLLGIFYGILLIMAVYNLLLFFLIRRSTYLFYVLYTLFVALYSMCQNGLGFQYLWPGRAGLNPYMLYLALSSIMFFYVLFSKKILSMKIIYPRLNKLLTVLCLLRLLVLFLGIFFYEELLMYIFLDLIPLFLSFGIAVAIFTKKSKKVPGYFLIANSLLITTFTVNIFEQYGIATSSIFTVYSMNIGIVIDIILFSMSLAESMRREINLTMSTKARLMEEMKSKEIIILKINQDLEEKVAARTSELNEAYEKLKKQAESILHMNLQLDLLNRTLQNEILQTNQKGIMKPFMKLGEFLSVYPDELACFRFIEELKNRKTFECKKCASSTFGKGKETFHRRCTKCGYNESITSNTIFNKIKFPIVKAFYIMYIVSKRQNITAEELSTELGLRKETCSVFKRKVLDRLKTIPQKDFESWEVLILND